MPFCASSFLFVCVGGSLSEMQTIDSRKRTDHYTTDTVSEERQQKGMLARLHMKQKLLQAGERMLTKRISASYVRVQASKGGK